MTMLLTRLEQAIASARGAAPDLERIACVAIAAISPSVGALPYRENPNGGPMLPPVPEDWAEHVLRHGEALRKALRNRKA